MTELEKMRNGDYYSMEDAEIIAIHQRAANICWRKRSIPTHSGWLYPLTFDAGKGLKEA